MELKKSLYKHMVTRLHLPANDINSGQLNFTGVFASRMLSLRKHADENGYPSNSEPKRLVELCSLTLNSPN